MEKFAFYLTVTRQINFIKKKYLLNFRKTKYFHENKNFRELIFLMRTKNSFLEILAQVEDVFVRERNRDKNGAQRMVI